MSLYAVKDKDGDLWGRAYDKPETTKTFRTWTDPSDAEFTRSVNYPDGDVVELVEKLELVEVSEKVGGLLAGLRSEITVGSTGHYANYYVRNLRIIHDMSIEDIFRALDVGWTVKQPQRWYVKAPKEWSGRGERQRFF
ncbi:hypothetical protein [Lacticaseibacillus pantheris]|nr:hypothetical protein [Lacticaseibacillus pantheris]